MQVEEFTSLISPYLYGYTSDTITSLMLAVIPHEEFTYAQYQDHDLDKFASEGNINEFLVLSIVHALCSSAGFKVVEVSFTTCNLACVYMHITCIFTQNAVHCWV